MKAVRSHMVFALCPGVWVMLAMWLPLLRAQTCRADEGPQQLRVAAVQMRSTLDLATNVERTIAWLRKCAAERVRVAVFPECSLTGYSNRAAELPADEVVQAEREVAAACRELDLYAVIGLPYREGEKLYNSASVITPEGKILERYHKVQLAESWPDAGDHLSIFRIDGVWCTIIICHDERYPELVRLPVLAGARVVFYISHESGLHAEHKLDPYRAQIQARAVENTVYVVHANAPANRDTTGSHGQSRIIDPRGNLVGREASFFKEEMLPATLDLRRATAANALRSIQRGILRDWWREGIQRVRRVESN